MGLFKRNVQCDEVEASTSSVAAARSLNNPTTASFDPADLSETRRKKSLLNLLGQSRVSEATLQVWRNLPGEIRHDPSMINFQREAERWKGECAVKFEVSKDDDDEADEITLIFGVEYDVVTFP